MLRGLTLKAVYQSDEDDLLRDFYIPTLKESVSYDRAVGFFSANMLSYAAQGLSAFVRNNGRMRLVVGGELDFDDAHAIQDGYITRALKEKLGKKIVEAIDAVDDALFEKRLQLLSWLVASGRLDVKLALKRRGMFHSKIGILTDSTGDQVIFQGSANETVYGLLPDFNFESVNVFPSWRSEFKEHFQPHVDTFERLWTNKARNTIVIDFPEAAHGRLVRVAKQGKVPTPEIELATWSEMLQKYLPASDRSYLPRLPESIGGREFAIMAHQRAALQAWRAAGAQGILALATGAGKTITAIYAAIKIFEQLKRLCLIIAVPYQNLADQWRQTLQAFNINAFACYGSSDVWSKNFAEATFMFQSGTMPFLCCVVVNNTLSSEAFQSVISQIPGENLLFVGDECHHHATSRMVAALPAHSEMRLGLSATPENYLNEDANLRLISYYGTIAYTYDLADALRDKVLTPYYYHVELIELTHLECEKYERLSTEIGRLIAQNGGEGLEGENSQLDRLLFQRARLLGGASNKLVRLAELLSSRPISSHTLFYSADGTVEGEDDATSDSGEPIRQVEAISNILYERNWSNARFTAREGQQERRSILDAFRIGDIEALVAMRCLDEGIDVPSCRQAFILASSRNPRQFIQRRGRILRRSPGKDVAEIFDFVVQLPIGIVSSSTLERQLLAAEFKRVGEFARLAQNAGEVIQTLLPLLKLYDLQHHLV